MLNRRFHLAGLLAVLLALMAQIGSGAPVPRIDPILGVAALCHADNDAGGTPSRAPVHPADCPICPLCVALHAPSALLLPGDQTVPLPAVQVVQRPELPPPSTAPPARHRPPGQPRAPPVYS